MKGGVRTSPPRSAPESLEQRAVSLLRRGDVVLFFHRTSWRSRVIRWVTACRMPHACVYAGRGRIVGMLRGRVSVHRLRRFFLGAYDIRIVRAKRGVLETAETYLERRESLRDLLSLGILVLAERASGIHWRNRSAYRMRGVTCAGVVAASLRTAYRTPGCGLTDTPRDIEDLIRSLGLRDLWQARIEAG